MKYYMVMENSYDGESGQGPALMSDGWDSKEQAFQQETQFYYPSGTKRNRQPVWWNVDGEMTRHVFFDSYEKADAARVDLNRQRGLG